MSEDKFRLAELPHQPDDERHDDVELHEHANEPQMAKHLRVHLVEIALASGNGVPVVAAQQHGDDLVADGNQNVVIEQPADGDDDRNQQKQRRIETYCTLGNISHEIQRSGFRQRTNQTDGNQESRDGEEHVDSVESAWQPLLHAVVQHNGYQR